MRDFTPFTLVFLRVATAALLLTIYQMIRGKSLLISGGTWAGFLVMALLNNVIPFSLIVWGQTQIRAGVASILNATTPIFTVIFAHFLTENEKMKAHKVIGVMVGFLGVYILMLPTLSNGFSLQNIAQFAVLGAASSYGFASIWGRRMGKSSPVTNTWGMLVCSSVILLPVIFVIEAPLSLSPSLIGWATVAALGAFSTAVAYLLFFQILRDSGATYIALVTFLIPITAMSLGVFFLGEVLHPLSLAGMAIIFAALILIDGRVFKRIRKG